MLSPFRIPSGINPPGCPISNGRHDGQVGVGSILLNRSMTSTKPPTPPSSCTKIVLWFQPLRHEWPLRATRTIGCSPSRRYVAPPRAESGVLGHQPPPPSMSPWHAYPTCVISDREESSRTVTH